MNTRSVITFFAFLVVVFETKCQNIYSKHDDIEFVNYLFAEGLYEEASYELENLVFYDTQNDSLLFLLLKSYRMSKQFEKGINRTHQITPDILKIPENCAYEYVLLMFKNNSWDSADFFLKRYDFKSDSIRYNLELHLNMVNLNWNNAKELLNKSYNSKYTCYNSIIDDGMSIKYKKPFLAAGLSSVIPGSGKIYSGYWMDGLTAFLSIAGLAYQSYCGFNRDGKNSVYGWVFASIGGVFYLSNIYGSAKSAKQINQQNEQKIIQRLDDCLDIY